MDLMLVDRLSSESIGEEVSGVQARATVSLKSVCLSEATCPAMLWVMTNGDLLCAWSVFSINNYNSRLKFLEFPNHNIHQG